MGALYPREPVEENAMSLVQYWPTADEINDCIKHEAEGAHDAVLLAVHRPTPLSYKLVSSGEKISASEEELFEFLLSRDVPSGVHVIPITGASGVGKSHMVRILNARLQSMNEDGKYVVIRIPKSASLRKVVELILEKLPEDEYAQVRAEFSKALTEDLNIETAVIRFQRELDIALGQLAKELEVRVRANPRDSALKEQWGHATTLPKFMGDPVLVDHFRERVFPRFVQRAIAGQHLAEQEELVKDFVPDDFFLPEIDFSKSAFQTNAYYTRNLLARDRDGMRVATRLLNEKKVVDQAIRQLFNLHQSLGGMTLQDVILEIRRRLLAQERELVIFVEDFKALTGIQDILLKVLIQEGVRDGVQELATMRSVIAVTDGYLDAEDTIATRAKREWKVESELSSQEEVLNRTKVLVASYLNAARWGFKELVRHFEAKRDPDFSRNQWIGPYTNTDDSSDSVILEAFGYQDEIPLFPYTEMAIVQLAKSALTRNNALVFTPRFIIDNVLRSLLLQGRPAFERGEFPPPSINAPSVNAEVAQWLGSLPVSTEMQERYRRIVPIWGNNPRTVSEVGFIPKEVFDAFKLDRPNIEFQRVPNKQLKVDPIQKEPLNVEQPKSDDEPLKATLEKWVQGERMPQLVANQIRKSVAAAINDRIDWSAERCAKVPIQSSQISIPNAGGETGITSNNPIKVAEDHTDQSGQIRSELAAVTRFYHMNSGKISYTDADDDLVWIGNLTDRLMPQALLSVRTGSRQKLGAALRLMQTNSQILGLTRRGLTPSSLAPFLFGEASIPPDVPVDAKAAFVEWRALQKKALEIRPELIQMTTSFCGSFQGTTGKSPYSIDMVRIVDSLQSDGGTQGVSILETPNELKSLLAAMTEARVNMQAGKVLQEANSIRVRLTAELGESFNKQEIVDELKGLAEQLSGVWPNQDIGMGMVAFKNRCDEFRSVAIREALNMLASVTDEKMEQTNSQQISLAGRLDVNPLIVAESFTETALKVIRASERQASVLESQFEGVDPQVHASEIQELFRSLINELESFSVEGNAP